MFLKHNKMAKYILKRKKNYSSDEGFFLYFFLKHNKITYLSVEAKIP